jgi:hypothetical protein
VDTSVTEKVSGGSESTGEIRLGAIVFFATEFLVIKG